MLCVLQWTSTIFIHTPPSELVIEDANNKHIGRRQFGLPRMRDCTLDWPFSTTENIQTNADAVWEKWYGSKMHTSPFWWGFVL